MIKVIKLMIVIVESQSLIPQILSIPQFPQIAQIPTAIVQNPQYYKIGWKLTENL